MKVYVVEFTFFSGVEWREVECEVKALTKESLKEAVMEELKYMKFEDPQQKWITEEELEFPLINIKPL